MIKLAVALMVVATLGCVSHERYDVRPDELAQLAALPPEQRATYALPATRVADHKQVYVVGSRVDGATTTPFEIRAPNRKVKIGAILVFVGTAVSLVGSGLAFFGSGKQHLAGDILAPVAEPVMIAGTIEWIIGALHPPGEIGAHQAGVVYLPR